jgi:hypothetical protein
MESCFGEIVRGWRVSDQMLEKTAFKIDVVLCQGGAVEGVTVVSTVGFSHFLPKADGSTKQLRQELFLMMRDGQFDPGMPAIFGQILDRQLIAQKGIMRGEVIHRPGKFFGSGRFVAMYATLPVYYPKEKWLFHDNKLGNILLCSLLPIMGNELAFINRHGHVKFDEVLEYVQFDPFDLNRPSFL